MWLHGCQRWCCGRQQVCDAKRLVHYELILHGHTVKKKYVEILHCLRGAGRRKCLEKLEWNSLFLLHNNAPVHWLLMGKKYLAKHKVTALEHPLYSPDPSPLFPCPWLQVFWKENGWWELRKSLKKQQEQWQRYQQIISRNASESSANVGQSVLLLNWMKCCDHNKPVSWKWFSWNTLYFYQMEEKFQLCMFCG